MVGHSLTVIQAWHSTIASVFLSAVRSCCWRCFALWCGERRALPNLELAFILLLFVALWLFFSGSNYTRLQFNTGIRYMAPMLPFLFVPAAIMLMRLPRVAIYVIAVISVTESWCLAMYRDVEHGFGVLDPILHVFLGGFQLPALTTLFHMGGQYGDFFRIGVSPLPLFTLAAVDSLRRLVTAIRGRLRVGSR